METKEKIDYKSLVFNIAIIPVGQEYINPSYSDLSHMSHYCIYNLGEQESTSEDDFRIFENRLSKDLKNYDWISIIYNDRSGIEYTEKSKKYGKVDQFGRIIN